MTCVDEVHVRLLSTWSAGNAGQSAQTVPVDVGAERDEAEAYAHHDKTWHTGGGGGTPQTEGGDVESICSETTVYSCVRGWGRQCARNATF
mmetsp:Transcript_54309/g.87922  ORF Transcript_54309/g.87922 Transcript_54309/m.87922 type:complete len:91 (+) Transcript_54309:773-1045(+)